jgi:hypothetical protein
MAMLDDIDPEAVEIIEEAAEELPTTGGALRAKLEEALARVKELEGDKDTEVADLTEQAMDRAFADNGLSRTEGLGKAIAAQYEGEATTEALAEHLLSEYDHEAMGAPNPIAAQVASAQSRIDMAEMGAGSVPITPTTGEELAAAEAAKDYDKTMAMKGAEVASWFGR